MLLRRDGKDASEFLEIRFDNNHKTPSNSVDEEFVNRVITVDCPYGSVTIIFDEYGCLKSLDIC